MDNRIFTALVILVFYMLFVSTAPADLILLPDLQEEAEVVEEQGETPFEGLYGDVESFTSLSDQGFTAQFEEYWQQPKLQKLPPRQPPKTAVEQLASFLLFTATICFLVAALGFLKQRSARL